MTIDNPKTGIKTRVTKLETATVNLNNRVKIIEDARKDVGGAAGTRGYENRLVTLENLCNVRSATGFSKKINKITEDLIKVAEIREDGEVILKPPALDDLKIEVATLKRTMETVKGYVHTLSKEVKSVDRRAVMNSAKLMKNTLLFGGVRCMENQSPGDALQDFLENRMQIVPEPGDVMEANTLGREFKKWVGDNEIVIPPPIKAQCTEGFAHKVMKNASILAGQTDEEYGFKFYVRRSMPEGH